MLKQFTRIMVFVQKGPKRLHGFHNWNSFFGKKWFQVKRRLLKSRKKKEIHHPPLPVSEWKFSTCEVCEVSAGTPAGVGLGRNFLALPVMWVLVVFFSIFFKTILGGSCHELGYVVNIHGNKKLGWCSFKWAWFPPKLSKYPKWDDPPSMLYLCCALRCFGSLHPFLAKIGISKTLAICRSGTGINPSADVSVLSIFLVVKEHEKISKEIYQTLV